MMFIVGIDVAKRSHEVSIITSEGQTVQRAFSISNNCTGYNCLMEKIRKLTNVRSEIVFAMESTAHYWLALYTHLHKDGYPVVVLNPIQTDAMREMFIRKTKTDAKDSLLKIYPPLHAHGHTFFVLYPVQAVICKQIKLLLLRRLPFPEPFRS